MIRVEQLTKTFQGRTILSELDFLQSAGETVVLIGSSGCGKSTFLRCLNQLDPADSGRIEVGEVAVECGKPVDPGRLRLLRRRVGMVFQQFHLFPHRTALENVMEGPLHVLGRPRDETRDLAARLLEKVGLSGFGDHHPFQLSGGQQQRVAIARALAMQPKVLLLDEPTSALDPQLRGEVRAVLRRLADDGVTMLLVTHDLRLARQVADRVAFLQGGRILEQGPAAQVLDSPVAAQIRTFLGQIEE